MNQIKCNQCQTPMRQTKKAERDFGMQLFGVAIFVLGVGMLFFFPIGTIAGLFLMLGAARMGYSKKKIWLCPSCGYFFERA